jgi:hypothetical protein
VIPGEWRDLAEFELYIAERIPFEPVKFRQVLIRDLEHQPPHSVARRLDNARGACQRE